jgi:hypothetical protein
MGGMAVTAVVVLGMAGVWKLQETIDRERLAIYEERDDLLLRSPRLVNKLSLEYQPLVAALYWTRAVQYYGVKHHDNDMRLQLLWPLLDIATTLDPKLIVAYRFGSTFLSDSPPRGAGRPDLAVLLLEKGLKANPDQWRLYQDLGNVEYFDAKNYSKAAEAFIEGSKNPGAPIWMKSMAAKIAAEGETPDISYALWLDVYETATEPTVKKNAESHLRLLKAEIDCRELDKMADEYGKRNGRRPAQMNELITAGLLKGVPADAEGFPYVFGPDGKAALNPKSPLVAEMAKEKAQR